MATVDQTPSGWYGFTLGPPMVRTSSPLAARAWSRDHFGVHPEPGSARQQAVPGVPLELGRGVETAACR